MGYFRKSAHGVAWVGAFRVSTRALAFARTIILARILSPAQFGVFAIATLVISFLEILTETGINVILIQKKGKASQYLDTAWVISIVRGVLIALLLVALAEPISTFFSSTESKNAIYIISLVALIRGFINPSIVNFQRDLRFASEFKFRFSVFAFDSAVAIVLSLATQSAMGLVWGLVAGAALELILSFALVSPRPVFKFKLIKAKEIISKGKWLTGAGILQFSFRQGDDAVVGRILGESSLGAYQVAYKISTMPVSEITDVFNRVVFPVYVKISGERDRLVRAFVKTTTTVSALAIVLGSLLFVFGEQLVLLLLGNQWLEVIPLIKVLSIFGIVQAIQNSMNSLLLALEKQHFVSFVTLVAATGLAVSILPLISRYGLVGAALAPLCGALLSFPLMIYLVLRSLNETNA